MLLLRLVCRIRLQLVGNTQIDSSEQCSKRESFVPNVDVLKDKNFESALALIRSTEERSSIESYMRAKAALSKLAGLQNASSFALPACVSKDTRAQSVFLNLVKNKNGQLNDDQLRRATKLPGMEELASTSWIAERLGLSSPTSAKRKVVHSQQASTTPSKTAPPPKTAAPGAAVKQKGNKGEQQQKRKLKRKTETDAFIDLTDILRTLPSSESSNAFVQAVIDGLPSKQLQQRDERYMASCWTGYGAALLQMLEVTKTIDLSLITSVGAMAVAVKKAIPSFKDGIRHGISLRQLVVCNPKIVSDGKYSLNNMPASKKIRKAMADKTVVHRWLAAAGLTAANVIAAYKKELLRRVVDILLILHDKNNFLIYLEPVTCETFKPVRDWYRQMLGLNFNRSAKAWVERECDNVSDWWTGIMLFHVRQSDGSFSLQPLDFNVTAEDIEIILKVMLNIATKIVTMLTGISLATKAYLLKEDKEKKKGDGDGDGDGGVGGDAGSNDPELTLLEQQELCKILGTMHVYSSLKLFTRGTGKEHAAVKPAKGGFQTVDCFARRYEYESCAADEQAISWQPKIQALAASQWKHYTPQEISTASVLLTAATVTLNSDGVRSNIIEPLSVLVDDAAKRRKKGDR